MATVVRIKHEGAKYGAVESEVRGGRRARDLSTLSGNDLAQLAADVWTLPQPHLRPGEGDNLLRLLHLVGQRRYGSRWAQMVATRIVAGVSPPDDARLL